MTGNELLDDILSHLKILTNAAEMERQAQVFYSEAAMRCKSPEGKKMLRWLAEFEKSHEARLLEQKSKLEKHPLMKGMKSPRLEEDYATSEASSLAGLPPKPSETDILKAAIINETKIYAFYQRKLTHAASDELKDVWEKMAADENRHIVILSEMRQRLINNKMWGDVDAYINELEH